MAFTDDSQALSQRKQHALELFAGLARSYDNAGAVMSLGGDARWRRAMIAGLSLGAGDCALDAATGTGLVAEELVRTHGCRVVAIDQSTEMLDAARQRLARASELRARVETRLGEAEQLPFADASFDAACFTYLLRYVDDPAAVLTELARVVKPGGQVASLEFAVPEAPVLRAGWTLYTRIGLPVVGRLFSREWYEVGRFLGPSIRDFYRRYPIEELKQLWRAAGFEALRLRRMSLGAALVIWGVRQHGNIEPR